MYTYRIELALKAATVLHKGQVRKGTVPVPYVSHLMAVALIASDYTSEEDVLIAALLHDTLEDTDYTADELEEDFGGTVRELVESVTEPIDTKEKLHTWRERKDYYSHQLKNAPHDALIVSAADKIHNMRSIVEEYFDDFHRFVADFGGSLDERILVYQEISNVLNRRLKNDILHEFNHVFTEYKKFIEDVKRSKEEPRY
jgi:(p)ppGpp synthase/HD superfamily hydrolase